MRRRNNDGLFLETVPPIIHNEVDNVWIFYTPQGKLVQSPTRDEAYAKWLLTKETN